ncbi:MAG: flavoprotein [Clostridiales bacterium GWF2_36_10]|nr:MAG: flavoprotein [Clostridiales bacterium GWF2_36_10]HAN20941.1 FprA family A-type flavoprotein [Clostridiales bacterium]
MQTLILKNDLYWNGILDPNLRVFDIIMKTEFGTTYNSYILVGSEKTALFETAKAKFTDEYIEYFERIKKFSEIDYIIVNHTEPDHSGSIEKILDLNPNITIVGTQTAISFLKKIVNREFKSIIAKDNDILSLGNKTLLFMQLPNLHWPDTMFTYVKEDELLFTCDAFGAHYSFEGVLRSSLPIEKTADYKKAFAQYFYDIIYPFRKPFMLNALHRLEGFAISMILTGHGPVIDSHIDEVMKSYTEWTLAENPNTKKTVIIPYVSAYGYTKEIGENIKNGIKASGDIDVRMYDMVDSNLDFVIKEIEFADGILFGSPTFLGDALSPIWDLLSRMNYVVNKGKLAAAFGSYGWSGEAVANLTERMKQIRLNVIDGLRIKFKPNDEDKKNAYDFGYNFGSQLIKK